eukprot:8637484-Pyramimonas_sp.AAC.1
MSEGYTVHYTVSVPRRWCIMRRLTTVYGCTTHLAWSCAPNEARRLSIRQEALERCPQGLGRKGGSRSGSSSSSSSSSSINNSSDNKD